MRKTQSKFQKTALLLVEILIWCQLYVLRRDIIYTLMIFTCCEDLVEDFLKQEPYSLASLMFFKVR